MVSIDAVLVLSGAVLTSYVGVGGLIRRMSLDQCLPQFLLYENKWRRTNHWILLLFFALCCSILALTAGEIGTLAGVYTLSFLGVMGLFAAGNMLLKVKRANLPRDERATWPVVVMGLLAVLVGLAGNLLLNPEYVQVFTVYFASTVLVVSLMFWRLEIFRGGLAVSRAAVVSIRGFSQSVNHRITAQIDSINSRRVVYFSKGGDLAALNRAALYVLNNELTNRMLVIHCFTSDEDIVRELADNLKIIDRIYPRLRIDLLLVKGSFSPNLIDALSRRLGVPKNYLFLGTPDDRFPHNIEDLGGVRLIM
jgi:amino acid transporter